MKRLLVPALVLVVMLLGAAQAQQRDPLGLDLTGRIENSEGRRCGYLQAYWETNPYFMTASLQNTTHHDLRVMSFSGDCMTDTLANRVLINDAIVDLLRGSYFVNDIRFNTQPGLPASSFQGKGYCLQSTNYPAQGIYVDYLLDEGGGSISVVPYMVAVDNCD